MDALPPAILIGDPRQGRHLQLARLALLPAGARRAARAGADAPPPMGDFVLLVAAPERPAQTTAVVRSLTAIPDCPPVVLLTTTSRVTQLAEAVAAAADGYLLAPMPPEQLALALERLAVGTPELLRGMVALPAEPVAPERGLTSPLSDREQQVLDLLRRGRSTREIAEQLAISSATVRTHVSAVVRKLRVADRKAAARTPEGTS